MGFCAISYSSCPRSSESGHLPIRANGWSLNVSSNQPQAFRTSPEGTPYGETGRFFNLRTLLPTCKKRPISVH
jgi:hypothetical protein